MSSAQLASFALQTLSAAVFSSSTFFCASTLASPAAISFSFSSTDAVAATLAAFASTRAAAAVDACVHTNAPPRRAKRGKGMLKLNICVSGKEEEEEAYSDKLDTFSVASFTVSSQMACASPLPRSRPVAYASLPSPGHCTLKDLPGSI